MIAGLIGLLLVFGVAIFGLISEAMTIYQFLVVVTLGLCSGTLMGIKLELDYWNRKNP